MSTTVYPNLDSLKKKQIAELLGVSVNCAPENRCQFNWLEEIENPHMWGHKNEFESNHYRCSHPENHEGDHECYELGKPSSKHDADCQYSCCVETVMVKKKKF